MKPDMIAPCGMNCSLCRAVLRYEGRCSGCRGDDAEKTYKSCLNCRIKNCERRAQTVSGFCYECDRYPCTRLKQLDKRYRTKYHMSMIENLDFIRDHGLAQFLERERARWLKDGCVFCVHDHKYFPAK